MSHFRTIRFILIGGCTLCLGLSVHAQPKIVSQPPKPKVVQPDLDKEADQDTESVTSLTQMLECQDEYEKGQPLSWEIVSPILKALRKEGVKLPPDSELKSKFLSQNDPFYKMLSSKHGRRFFDELSKFPESIDRAERYLSLPNGRKELQFIMTRKGGAEFFTDMVDNQNGRETARMIAKNNNSKDFEKPTGKIYLEPQLAAFLKTYDSAAAVEEKKSSKKKKYD